MTAKTEELIENVSATDMLRQDHEKVKALFEEFESSEDTRKEIAEQVLQELKIHTQLEEELFYPAVREELEESELMDEAEQEHHVVDLLIGELEEGPEKEVFKAKFMVMAENVKHHIEEEESEVFSKMEELDINNSELAEKMAQRKMEIQEEIQSGGSKSGRSSSPSKKQSRKKSSKKSR